MATKLDVADERNATTTDDSVGHLRACHRTRAKPMPMDDDGDGDGIGDCGEDDDDD